MRTASHHEAVRSLVSASSEVVLEVSHDAQPAGLQVTLLRPVHAPRL